MRKISRKDCVVLPLVLKGKWYDMIASGEKKEEYREHKEFWIKRIEKWQDSCFSNNLQKVDVIAFSCGYKKPDMFFICDRILIREKSPIYLRGNNQPHPDWGEPNIRHFALGLGERIEVID